MTLRPLTRTAGLALTAAALALTTSCATSTTATSERPDDNPSTTTAAPGPWDDFGLPGPGSPGTDTTVSVADINFINEGRLDDVPAADRKILLKSMKTVFEQAYWNLESFPERVQKVGQFDDYFSPDAAKDFNDSVRDDGSASFGVYTAERNGGFYQYTVDSIDVEVLDAYVPDDKSFGPYAKFRVSTRASWTSLPWTKNIPKKLKGKPKTHELTTKVEAGFSNVDDDEFAELIGWENQDFNLESTPIEMLS